MMREQDACRKPRASMMSRTIRAVARMSDLFTRSKIHSVIAVIANIVI
jgi:hypothetical protein